MGIFSKPEVNKLEVTKPSSVPAPPRGAPAPPSGVSPATVIGPAAHVKGELVSSDNLHIEGKVEGKVKSSKQVIIGEKGFVQAEVEAEVVTIRGKLEGDCVASNKVEITSTGKVYGNITAPRIAVVEGAIFRGASSMTSEKKSPPPATAPAQKPDSLPADPSPESGGKEAHPSNAGPKN